MTALQPVLLPGAVVGLEPVSLAEANALLAAWGHYLGPCHRPFGSDCWALQIDGRPVSVAVGASIVSNHISEDYQDEDGNWCRRKLYDRDEVVELARLCSDPATVDAKGKSWATRPMLRLWREVAAPRWPYWPVRAAIAYSATRRHEGDVYRFDGWTAAAEGCGSNGGGHLVAPSVSHERRSGPEAPVGVEV